MDKINQETRAIVIGRDNIDEYADDTTVSMFGPDISAAVVCMDAVSMQDAEKEILLDLYHECVNKMRKTEYACPYFETELKAIRPILGYFGRLPFGIELHIHVQ